MKRIAYILGILAITASSCAKLDETPYTFISPEIFYKTRNDAIAAVTAAYSSVRNNGFVARNYAILGEITTDNMFPLPNNADRIQLDNYVHNSQNVILRETWQTFYQGIHNCNFVIDYVPKINMDETLRARLVGEAKFLRAFYYFHLTRLFGDLPLMVTATASLDKLTYPKRDPRAKVYEQIILDLKDAEEVLPISYTGADQGRATKGAAKAFLASAYLTTKQYQLAYDKAAEVMAPSMGYGLWDNYADVFDIKNEFGKEAIFDAQFMSGPNNQGGNLIAFFAQENNSVGGRGFGSFQPTQELYDAFNPADKRREVFFTKGTDNKYYCNKWIDADAKTENQSDNNYPLMRYADVVLIAAEAYNEVHVPVNDNAAYKAVNSIRKRAGLPDFQNLSQAQLRDSIFQERRLELCFEGHRWFDLVRTDKLVSTLTAKGTTNIKAFHVLFPVPQFEIDLNPNLKPQNTGYDPN
ncbi:SusD-like starch-binding protein associating with outer membrane [Chitinophaga skermanii]|uniref:SusD-like starch-binding protein associating with outer membrane n=1 Tax=Chitinophaga skermanii TaxID=331697 RepID=A0A327R4H2_9BACT|nr:RagB/SusD family nutrient uptake outer membrane protein [Chitinophaga skermanii]RAJ11115.1 SusD-like starch-binding protein associating with outer membrane [Chitinophaga skermanii]